MASSDADVVSRVQHAVRAALDRSGLIEIGRPLVVAVSGGADSSCLLDALVAVLPDATDRLVVGHVDHQLRPDSAADAEHVRALATSLGLRFESLTVDVPGLMREEGRGLEDAARVGRYRALRELCRAVGGIALATGHTRDDSVETVLMHVLRGSGRAGLGGIAEVVTLDALADGNLPDPPEPLLKAVRPLLGVERGATTAYCQARSIRWMADPTNADPRMLRNRVRRHLLPILRTYNPAVDDALDRLSQVMRDEDAYLNELTEQQFRRMVRSKDGQIHVELPDWIRQPQVIQRRLVRRIAQGLGHTEMSRDTVERALTVCRDDGPRRAELGHGLVVSRHRGNEHMELVFEMTQRGTP